MDLFAFNCCLTFCREYCARVLKETSPLSVKGCKRHGSSIFTVSCEEHGLLKTIFQPGSQQDSFIQFNLFIDSPNMLAYNHVT